MFFGNRKIFIAKEITKMHESFFRENVDKINLFKNLKGELTVVISEKDTKNKIVDHNEIKSMAKRYLKTLSLKDTVEIIFKKVKINKKIIYKICLDIKNK